MLDIRGARISMILQDPKFSLNPVQRVGDQIAEAYAVHHRGARRAAREKALEMLEAVQIRDPERVYRLYPHEISGGMGQRVMIAMMLVPEPELIIADEPTSALDVTVRMKVLGILDELVRERGIGLIMICHDLNLVRNFCDRVLIMYAGQVVEALPAAELAHARHDYTRGLIAAQPHIGGDRGAAGGAAAGGELEAAAGGGEPMSDILIENLTISLGLGERGPADPRRRELLGALGPELRPRRRIRVGQVDDPQVHRAAVQRLDRPHRDRRQAGRARPRARPTAATCRWYSRTPTARCTRATRSAPR